MTKYIFIDPDDKQHIVLYNLMQALYPREQTVLVHHYGLFGVDKKSFGEIAPLICKTRERTRQIEVRALMKLKCHEYMPLVRKLEPSDLLGAIMGYCDCGCIYQKNLKIWKVGEGVVCDDCLKNKQVA
jgi:hypothetical protein